MLLALVALIYLVLGLPIASLGEVEFGNLSWWVIPTVMLFHLVYLLLSAEVWRRMMRMTANAQFSFLDAYLQMAAVAIGKYIPGKVWGFVARTGQLHRHNVPAHLSLMSTVLEQILVLVGSGVVVIVAGLIAFPEHAVAIGVLGLTMLIVLIVVSSNFPAITQWLRRKHANREMPEDIAGVGLSQILQYVAAYALLWLISGLILSIIYFSLSRNVATIDAIAVLVLANTLGFVVGFFAVFAPGGLGVREAATVAVLAPILPLREVIVATIVLRACIVLFDGINAVITLIGESRQAVKTSSRRNH